MTITNEGDEAYFEFVRVNKDYPDGLNILKKRKIQLF
jgi:hypothetical protein